MKNIIIYSAQTKSELVEILSTLDDATVRVESEAQIKEYALLNPNLLIVEQGSYLKDVLMTTKFSCPVLFLGPVFTDTTVRS